MWLRLQARDFLSFEAVFVLFIFAGVIKGVEPFASINEQYDITVVTALAGMLAGFIVFLDGGVAARAVRWEFLFAYSAFVSYAWLSCYWGAYLNEEAIVKFQKLAFFNTWALVAPLVLINSRDRVKRFLRLFFFATIFLGLDALVRHNGAGLVRAVGALGIDSYQALGNLMALGVEIAIVGMIFSSTSLTRITLGTVTALLLLAMLLSGARQSAAGLVVSVAFLLFSLPGSNTVGRLMRRAVPLVLLVSASLVIIRFSLFQDLDMSWGVDRITRAFAGVGSDAVEYSGRTYIWRESIEIWREHPVLGAGFGSFRLVASTPEFRHPHNMFLEYLCEMGVVGLVIALLMWAGVVRRLFDRGRLQVDPLFLTLCMMWLHALTTAQVSGDIPGNRFLFTLAGFVVCLPARSVLRRAAAPRTTFGEDRAVSPTALPGRRAA